jgi:hypothetical protein
MIVKTIPQMTMGLEKALSKKRGSLLSFSGDLPTLSMPAFQSKLEAGRVTMATISHT